MTSNLLDRAKLGDPQAISTLMNESLQSRGIRAEVSRLGDCLEVLLEAERLPNRQALVSFVQQGIHNLEIQSIGTVRILGQQIGAAQPAWVQEVQVEAGNQASSNELVSEWETEEPYPTAAAVPLNIQPEAGAEITAETWGDTGMTSEIAASEQTADELSFLNLDPVSEDPASLTEPLTSQSSPLEESLDADLNDLWAQQPETAPDFLQELLAEDPEAIARRDEWASTVQPLDWVANPASSDASLEDLNLGATEFGTPPTEAEFQELFAPLSSPQDAGLQEPGTPLSDDRMDDVMGNDSRGEAISRPDSLDASNLTLDRLFGSSEELPTAAEPEEPSPWDLPSSSEALSHQIEALFDAEEEQPGELFTEETLPGYPSQDNFLQDDDLDALPDFLTDPMLTDTDWGVTLSPNASSNTSSNAVDEPLPEAPPRAEPDPDPIVEFRSEGLAASEGFSEEFYVVDPPGTEPLAANAEDGVVEAPPAMPEPTQSFWAVSVEEADVAGGVVGGVVSKAISETIHEATQGTGEELPPDFLQRLSEEGLPEESPPLPPMPEPRVEPEATLAAELAALDLTSEPSDLGEPLQTFGDPSLDLTLDQSDVELAELLNTTPQGRVVKPGQDSEPGAFSPQPTDFFPESIPPGTLPDSPTSQAEQGNVQPALDSPDLSPDLSPANSPTLSPVSQDELESGLGDFREGFVEPLPEEFFEDEAPAEESADWKNELKHPLDLSDFSEDTAENYVIEDNTPEYTPPPLPSPPEAAASTRTASWLFPLVLFIVGGWIAGLLSFALFWSKISPPPSPPPVTEPPAPNPSPAPPASPTSVNPPSPAAKANALKSAINQASDAVALTQAAQSADDWRLIASKWQQAIDLLKSVPRTSADHAPAQQKLSAYQANLTVARQKANLPIISTAPLGLANVKTDNAANPDQAEAQATPTDNVAGVVCSPVALVPDTPSDAQPDTQLSNSQSPNSQPVELSRVQFAPAPNPTQASPIVGCITNHTEQPIASVNLVYQLTDRLRNRVRWEETGNLSFAQLNPKQTVPFQSEFTIAPEVQDLTIAAITWTAIGNSSTERISTAINITRENPQEQPTEG